MKKTIFLIILMILSTLALVSAAVCEDNKCELPENKDNCPQDCGAGTILRGSGEPTYRSKDALLSAYKNLCLSHMNLCSYETIGKSLEGKDILMFKFGNPEGGKVMMDGLGHGTEDCGSELGYTFAKNMMESNDEYFKKAREGNYYMVIPVLNIDKYRRQNARSVYSDGTKVTYGVDLNRNSPVGWGSSGSSDPTHSYEYRGQSAASEPETQAIVAAMKKYSPDVYINTHCGMYLWNYYPMNNITQKIIDKVKVLATEDNVDLSKYPARSGCAGGHICRTGGTYGKSGWILEVAVWDDLPKTLSEYNTKYYQKFETIMLGTLQAVEKPQQSTDVKDKVVIILLSMSAIILVAMGVLKLTSKK